MSDFNPYAPPQSQIIERGLQLTEGEGLWRDGHLLVVRKGAAEFPDHCLRCNEPALGYRFKRTLSWHPVGWYLLVPFNVIIYIIVAMCVRWTAKIAAPICPRHRSLRRRAIALGWIGSLAGISLIIFGGSNRDYAYLSLVGLILFLGSLIGGVIGSQLLIPKRIDKHLIWLKKVSPDFLAALPSWQ